MFQRFLLLASERHEPCGAGSAHKQRLRSRKGVPRWIAIRFSERLLVRSSCWRQTESQVTIVNDQVQSAYTPWTSIVAPACSITEPLPVRNTRSSRRHASSPARFKIRPNCVRRLQLLHPPRTHPYCGRCTGPSRRLSGSARPEQRPWTGDLSVANTVLFLPAGNSLR